MSAHSALGRRIQIVGPSCSGKSTLGELLAARLEVPFVELDALFWKPGWTEPPAEEFQAKLTAFAAANDAWVMSGQYHRHTAATTWPSLQTVVWLDFPVTVTVPRIVRRSWKRWRSGELLWGTNTESFFGQFKLWSRDSLITYTVLYNRRNRRRYLDATADPRWAHIRFIRLRSPGEVATFVAGMDAEPG